MDYERKSGLLSMGLYVRVFTPAVDWETEICFNLVSSEIDWQRWILGSGSYSKCTVVVEVTERSIERWDWET